MILSLVWMFLKVGFLGFGGGYAMLALINSEAISLGLTNAQFADMMVIDFLIPGPIAINSATYVGYILSYQAYGYLLLALVGATVATMTVTLPSFVFAPTFIRFEKQMNQNQFLHGIISAVKGAAVGLIIAVAFDIFIENVLSMENIFDFANFQINYFLLALVGVTFILLQKYKVSPILLTIIAGIVGFLFDWIF